ncbi:pyridoxal-phosphate dependent enzyme [Mesorhizobium microcysteis]|uniref:Pyridoxal-phosphate dependent enzyme n=1 Tax=Neoaquamicrobium microcysteis TaxID=2682781 RepID=A0A5D4H6R4_9HYPH|nr:pyridoxal-phosphate dependent enzyme [Mesorhizobium microcysteis]TYR36741.1 pyridoxal-phosphate dependent enzyme [Mesorhizobium microcysteis]
MASDIDYFRALETPRLSALGSNLVAAAFPMMKLMPARFILDRAEKAGELSSGGRIIETTSGTFGLALAMLAAARSYPLTLVTAKSLIDPPYQKRLEMLGAEVVVLDDDQGDGNQAGRIAYLHDRLEAEPSTFWTRQYDNPGNPHSYARLAEMLVRRVGRIDWLVGCAGTGGSLCGTGAFLRHLFPDMKIAAVDTHNSVLFGHKAGRRMLRGLGNSVMPGNVKHNLIDEVHWVGAYVAYRSAHRLLREQGMFMGPTSGAAAIVAEWIARRDPDASVVAIMPDEGFRYSATVYDQNWLNSHPGWTSTSAYEPANLTTIEPRTERDWTRFEWGRSQKPSL